MKFFYTSIILLSFILTATQLFAATNNYWVGSTNWNVATNWSLGHIPTNSEIAPYTVTGTNTKACVINIALTGTNSPAGISISGSYASKISINSGLTVSIGASGISMTGILASAKLDLTNSGVLSCSSITIQKGVFSANANGNSNTFSGAINMTGGSFNGGSAHITVGGAFSLSGGATTFFNSTSGILTLGPSFRPSGNFNPNLNGTVIFPFGKTIS